MKNALRANDQVDVKRNCITEEGASLMKTFLESSPHANALDNKVVNLDDDDDRQANALGNNATTLMTDMLTPSTATQSILTEVMTELSPASTAK